MAIPAELTSEMTAVSISPQPDVPVGFMSTPVGTQFVPPANASHLESGISAFSHPVAGSSAVPSQSVPSSAYYHRPAMTDVSGIGALQQQVIDKTVISCSVGTYT